MADEIRLDGERLYLRTMTRADLPHVRRWLADKDLRRRVGVTQSHNEASIEEWFDGVVADGNRRWFTVVLAEDDRPIGEAGLLRITEPWRCADVSMILGERDCLGRGYGSEAMRLLLDYAFGEMGLHRIGIGVFDFNAEAIRYYEKNGFRREGVLRDGYFCDGAFHDVILMSVLENEYRARPGNARRQ